MTVERLTGRHLLKTYARYDTEFVRGEGARLWDTDGNEYLDFLSGIGVTSVGHCHPRVVEAIGQQAARLIHVGNLYYTDPMARLADRLAGLSLGGGVFVTNSGAEAIEAAIKVARKAKQGGDVITFHRAFHGRTYGALSATPQEAKQAPFAPLVPGFRAIHATTAAIGEEIDDDTAAVIIEPIQGETGVHVIGDEVLMAARKACDRHGASLIFDEIQCGLGRTGARWGYEWSDVVPDALTTAKALGGGLAIGAMVTGERLRDVLVPGDHGSTFAGGPVPCAAAHAALDVLMDEVLLERVRDLGDHVRAALAEMPGVIEVRGRGLMIGFDLDGGDAPDVVLSLLRDERLVVNATGPQTVRLLPPLIIDRAQADDALARIARTLSTRK
jgi:acetylornithine/N-succinyldiaminopimelate aminotransferase